MIKFLNRYRIEDYAGNNQKIIYTIIKYVEEGSNQVFPLRRKFLGKNKISTCAKIWGFLKYFVTYQKDMYGQDIKLPSALLHYRKGDCKSYALFTVSILKALDMPAYLRFACYDNSEIPSHVYAYTKDDSGKEIIIDACYSRFDTEKKYKSKKDYKV